MRNMKWPGGDNLSTVRRRPVYLKLKAFFVEHDISQAEVADLIEVTRSTFNQKLNGLGADFTLEEARLICDKYHLNMDAYFSF